jgi:hypothetical protein
MGQTSFAALSQTVKTKWIGEASGFTNSFHLWLLTGVTSSNRGHSTTLAWLRE